MTAALLTPTSALAADTTVTTSAELVAAINAANTNPDLDTIIVSGTIVLEENLPKISEDLIIQGADANATINGAGLYDGIDVAHSSQQNQITEFTAHQLTLTGFASVAAVKVFEISSVSLSALNIYDTDSMGVFIWAGDDQKVNISDVTISNTGYEAFQFDNWGNSEVKLQNIKVTDLSSSPAVEAWFEENATISIDGFEIENTHGAWFNLMDATSISLNNGLISNTKTGNNSKAALFIGNFEDPDIPDGASETKAVIKDVAIVDAETVGVAVMRNGSTDIDSLTVEGTTSAAFIHGSQRQDSTLNVLNSTISNNDGVGVSLSVESPKSPQHIVFDSVTIADNTDESFVVNAYDDTVGINLLVRNSIISGFFDDDDEYLVEQLDGILQSEYSLWNGVTPALTTMIEASGTGNLINLEPMLAPLADNGGFTPTRLLLEGSPAIDSGDPAASGYASVNDQRHKNRIYGDSIDMGATEYIAVDDEDNNSDSNSTDGNVSNSGTDSTDNTADDQSSNKNNLSSTGNSVALWLMLGGAATVLLGAGIFVYARARSKTD